MIIRIFKEVDGHLKKVIFNEKKRRKGESDKVFMDRLTEKLPYKKLPYVDIDTKNLPDKSVKNKWRLKGNTVVVDQTLETYNEALQREEKLLDDEITKPAPDVLTVIKQQRKLEKLKGENWLSRKKI